MSVIKDTLKEDKDKILYLAEWGPSMRRTHVSTGEVNEDNVMQYELVEHSGDPTDPQGFMAGDFGQQGQYWLDQTGYEGQVRPAYGYDEVRSEVLDFYKELPEGENFDLIMAGHADAMGQFYGISPNELGAIFDEAENLYGDRLDETILHSCYMGDNELACGMISEELDSPVTAQTRHKWGTGVLRNLSDENLTKYDKSIVPGAKAVTYYPGFLEVVNKAIDEQKHGGISHAGLYDDYIEEPWLATHFDDYEIEGFESLKRFPTETIKKQIVEMHDKGWTAEAIANALDITYGTTDAVNEAAFQFMGLDYKGRRRDYAPAVMYSGLEAAERASDWWNEEYKIDVDEYGTYKKPQKK